MLTKELLLKETERLGVSAVGIGAIDRWKETAPAHSPLSILPKARCVIGLAFRVPTGLYAGLKHGQALNFTNFAVRFADETLEDIALLRLAHLLEDNGYDACIQRRVSNLRVKGDPVVSPEVASSYELVHAVPVAEGKPAPEVIIDFEDAAVKCGLGSRSLRGGVLSPEFGPFFRTVYIITDAPLESDPFCAPVCDGCGKCVAACPAHAISADRFDHAACRNGYGGEDAVDGYRVCRCGKACDVVCYEHLKGVSL